MAKSTSHFLALCALFGLFLTVVHGEVEDRPRSLITQLTDKTFEPHLKGKDLALVQFYAGDCILCGAVHAALDHVRPMLKEENIEVARIFCDDYTALCKRYNVENNPHLKVFRNGIDQGTANVSNENPTAILDYMKNLNGPVVDIITRQSQLRTCLESHAMVMVGAFDTEEDPLYEDFAAVATALREKGKFVALFGEHEMKFYGVNKLEEIPFFYFHANKNTEMLPFLPPVTVSRVNDTLKVLSLTPLQPVDDRTIEPYLSAGLPVMIVIHNTTTTRMRQRLKDTISEFRTRIVFAGHRNPTPKLLSYYDIAKADLPAIFVEETEHYHRYHCPHGGKFFDAAKVKEWLGGVVAGTIPPTIRSEAEEVEKLYNVRKLVYSNYNEFVRNPHRTVDMMVLLYSPLDQMSLTVVPTFTRLARAFTYSQLIEFGRMNVDGNDMPEGLVITSTPTIIFYGADGKDIWVYKDRSKQLPTIDELLEFLHTHSKVEFQDSSLYFPNGKYGELSKEKNLEKGKNDMEKMKEKIEENRKKRLESKKAAREQDDDDFEEIVIEEKQNRDEL